jgi:HK97 family phage major capsid protein
VADLKALRDEYEETLTKARTISEQHKAGITAEKAVEVDALLARCAELKGQIDDERKAVDRKTALDRAHDYLERPDYKGIPRSGGVGDDEPEDKKALARQGWEFKGGIVYAPHSRLGETYVFADGTTKQLGPVPMFGEDVLWGPLPDDNPELRRFYETTRHSFKPEYRKSYERMILMSARVPVGMGVLSFMTASEQKALSEGLDQAGGFLVPPDVQAEVLARTAQVAVFRRNARIQATSRDVLKWPTVSAAAATEGGLAAGGGSVFSSGFVGSWVGEVPSQADKDPVFSEFDVPIRKLRVQTRLSNDFIADSAANVLAFLATNGGENMGLVEDMAFFVGSGNLQPTGALISGAVPTAIDVEGSTANTISNTTSAAGSAPKLIDLIYALPAQYLSGAKVYSRRAIEGKIRKLVDFQGRFLWPAGSGSQFAAAPRSLLDYPIENSDFIPNDGTDTNRVLLFGNLASGYIIGQRAQITSTVLRERYADTDQTGIILWERVGGDVWNGDALRVGAV